MGSDFTAAKSTLSSDTPRLHNLEPSRNGWVMNNPGSNIPQHQDCHCTSRFPIVSFSPLTGS